MEIERKKNKRVAWGIYLLLWPVLLIIQSLIIGGSAPEAPYFWQEPGLYYSLWITDLFLIALWYANYYLFAPRMMRKRMFGPYIMLVVLMMLIGLFLQLLLHALFGWATPANPYNGSVSVFGCLGALSLMALGLSVRGVAGWLKSDAQVKELKATCAELEERNKQLEDKLSYYDYRELPPKDETVVPDVAQLPDFSSINDAEFEGSEPLTGQDDTLGESDPPVEA